jgi:hypothetical protein
VFVSLGQKFIKSLIPIRSVKHRLIIKLIIQIEANLRDESIKSN